jgi:monoamine oxidase
MRSEADIVVIGAGAAGIAAGCALLDAKADFIVLEARGRTGGRSHTAVNHFPLDLGCGWLHSGDRNPWTAIAAASGFTIDRTPAPWTLSSGGVIGFARGEWEDFRKAASEFYARLEAAAEEAEDRACITVLETGNRWNELLNAISTYANGAEYDRISVKDSNAYDDSGVNYRKDTETRSPRTGRGCRWS